MDYDFGLSAAGCFRLKRLELIDVPLARSSAAGGVALDVLRAVLRSLSGLTHLSLSGSFCNWDDAPSFGGSGDTGMLLCGSSWPSAETVAAFASELKGQEESLQILR